jgi:hypothetical protein
LLNALTSIRSASGDLAGMSCLIKPDTPFARRR